MRHDIHLSGSDITFLKALGLGGTPLAGHLLLTRMGETDEGELVDTIKSLVEMDYVSSTKVNIMKIEDVERSSFRVNSSYADALRDAMHPGRRTEDRARRRRRRE
ncbi:MAG: hypothetical protein QOG48_789 [Verrucomicrobiota bacterium]